MNLSVDGDSDYVDTGTPDSASPVTNSTNGIDGSDLIAAMLNGLLVAVPELQTLLGNALTLKGSTADLATRLARVIETDGAFRKGTSFPGTPVGGQPFWRTDQALFYVYDAVSGQWILGQDNPLYALIDGTRDFTGNIKIKAAVPGYRLTGTEVGARDILLAENGGFLFFYDNTGTEAVPVWTERAKLNMATGALTIAAGLVVSSGGVVVAGNANITGNLDVSGTMNSGTVPLARLGALIPQANMASASIGTSQLKTATGSASSNNNDPTVTMNDYAFFPTITNTSNASFWDAGSVANTADPGDTVGRFRLRHNVNDPAATVTIRWRYVTASDKPDAWIIKDPATGLLIASWWSDDPAPIPGSPIAIEGLQAMRLTVADLERLTIPSATITDAADRIRDQRLNQANLAYRALALYAGDEAPSKWLIDNCKIGINGRLTELTAQEKSERSTPK